MVALSCSTSQQHDTAELGNFGPSTDQLRHAAFESRLYATATLAHTEKETMGNTLQRQDTHLRCAKRFCVLDMWQAVVRLPRLRLCFLFAANVVNAFVSINVLHFVVTQLRMCHGSLFASKKQPAYCMRWPKSPSGTYF